MKVELFPFQKRATTELRLKIAEAMGSYRRTNTPQVVSLQAPTGSGKTIIMASLIEDVYFGTDQYAEQPEAIFVWLSDSPALNAQSKQKIDLKADKIRFGQCITIEDESFDQEMLDDGHIYFLNTQKIGRAANLGRHSDKRQYTIWETLQNTLQSKSDRLYFIIDEAHRGMQGKEAATANTIMQRFLKGEKKLKLSPMPLVIGISATAERFNRLVGDIPSTLQKCIVTANEVRASGLLKDRIVITYPNDMEKNNEMALLQAAADEWKSKCDHWNQYCTEQHYAQVNPVFVIQVLAGNGKAISDTNLDDVVASIEERLGIQFKENEVVHTFGSNGNITVNGLIVPHIESSEIAEDRRIRVVLFKENLSTGWDCPRAETMMSFRHATDATYIAQLLGRMVRTPLQCHILVDDSLNEVKLFLPHFNKDTVKSIVEELQSTEGGDIPTVIEGESLEDPIFVSWTVHPHHKKTPDTPLDGQISLQMYPTGIDTVPPVNETETELKPERDSQSQDVAPKQVHPQQEPIPLVPVKSHIATDDNKPHATGDQLDLNMGVIDREAITKFINKQGFLTYQVRSVKINNYLKSMLNLASLLTQSNIYPDANNEIETDVVNMIHTYIDELHRSGKYDDLAAQVLSFKLAVRIFDIFGESLDNGTAHDFITASESDLDRQLRAADARMGAYGFPNEYGKIYADLDDPSGYKIDCILFAADDDCIARLNHYAENKFHSLNDDYRKYVVTQSEHYKKQYSDIIADGDVVSKHNFTLPEIINVKIENGGTEYTNHLFADSEGFSKIKLNGWEQGVLKEEASRDDFVCWLRNPSRGSWSLCIPYEIDGEMRPAYPDFLIIRKDPILQYVVDILEPHSPDFKDNLGKAKGFAQYAEQEPRVGRVQIIRQSKDAAGNARFKRLDLAKGSTREKVLKAINNDELDHIFDTDGFFD